MFCMTDIILQNIPHIRVGFECGEYIFCKKFSIPQNIVMDLNNVMVP
jgi:hypothetical protein